MWAKFLLGKKPGLVTVFAHYDGNLQPAGQEQGFVAKVARGSAGIDEQNAAGLAAVTSREDVEGDPAGFQQLAEKNHERSFPRAADREIADAYHRPFESPGGQEFAVVERVFGSNRQAVDGGERIQEVLVVRCRV